MIEQLSREHQALGYMLRTEGWNEVYRSRMVEEARELNKRLLDPSTRRKDSASDDYLRGAIYAIKRAIEWPDEEMNMAAAELLQRASEAQPDEEPLVGGSRPPLDEEERPDG